MKKIMVCNRGEIALRVIQAIREKGHIACLTYAENDYDSLALRAADEAYSLGEGSLADTYLNQDKIIEIALKNKIDAIHPGYGFLSENANFSEKVEENSIIFIGPRASAIRTMGDKLEARKTMEKAGVPVVPGSLDLKASVEDVINEAKSIGVPIMVKAVAGGGGKGMRLVTEESEIGNAIERASSEALGAFGNGNVYVEKFIGRPRHIEVQVLGDGKGKAIALTERECSIQRRHQKVIEESPSVFLEQETREKLLATSRKAVEFISYRGAGTIEFLVGEDQQFYFLEMNTRLQVEHPVTENIHGIDLVHKQIDIALDGELEIDEIFLSPRGHSIECRICAEDPNDNFRPSPGKVNMLKLPSGPGIRLDSCLHDNLEVSPNYDPMVAKLISFGSDREQARNRMIYALENLKIGGLTTNVEFHKHILRSEDFKENAFHTRYLEDTYLSEHKSFNYETENENLLNAAILTKFLKTLSGQQKERLKPAMNDWNTLGKRGGLSE